MIDRETLTSADSARDSGRDVPRDSRLTGVEVGWSAVRNRLPSSPLFLPPTRPFLGEEVNGSFRSETFRVLGIFGYWPLDYA